MMKVSKNVLKVVEHVVRNEVKRNSRTKIPFCTGIFHQPKRPVEWKEK